MVDLKGYEVKTKGFGVLRCYYLLGNKLYVHYSKSFIKGNSTWHKGHLDLSVSTKDVIQTEYEWPVISKEAVPRLTFSDVVDDKGNSMSFWIRKFVIEYESRVFKLTEARRCLTNDAKVAYFIDQAETYLNDKLSRWALDAIDEYNSRVINILNVNQIATICNLIEVSCGKSKVSQSFKSVGLELRLEYDPDNLTGAIKVADGRTIEEAILNSLNHTA